MKRDEMFFRCIGRRARRRKRSARLLLCCFTIISISRRLCESRMDAWEKDGAGSGLLFRL